MPAGRVSRTGSAEKDGLPLSTIARATDTVASRFPFLDVPVIAGTVPLLPAPRNAPRRNSKKGAKPETAKNPPVTMGCAEPGGWRVPVL
jgi:hypothetical protein